MLTLAGQSKELGSRCCVSKLPSLRVMAVRPRPLLGSGQQGKSRNIFAKEPLNWAWHGEASMRRAVQIFGVPGPGQEPTRHLNG